MLTALRIAVADDEPDLQEYFRRVLPRLGHEVVSVAATGRELVEDCFRLCPDLVITDLRMPEMDGLEAAEAISQHLHIPVIIVSATEDARLARQLASENVMMQLVKPIKMADLQPAITQAIKRHSQLAAPGALADARTE